MLWCMTVQVYLRMLAEPLQVEGDIIEQVVRVLINQLLQGEVVTSFTDVPHTAQRCLADQ